MTSSSAAGGQPLILLAEDSSDDVFFMQRALEIARIANPLAVAADGQEAVDYLEGIGPFADRQSHPFPRLLLLDIKMPRMNGFDVLAWLSAQSQISRPAVVMLSSSDLESDIEKARLLGADDYRVKPHGLNALVVLLHQLHARWLTSEARPASRVA